MIYNKILNNLGINNNQSKITDSPFGLHGVFGQNSGNQAKDINASYIRKMVRWGEVEPSKGKYNVAEMDAVVKDAQSNGFNLVVSLVASSPWGGTNKQCGSYTCTGLPTDKESWNKFVSELVQRYDGDGVKDMSGLNKPIKYWQIENEWTVQWQDSKEAYLEHLKNTSGIIKKIDPSAKIILGSGAGSDKAQAAAQGYWISDTFKLGITDDKMQVIPIDNFIEQASSDERYITAKQKTDFIYSKAQSYFDIVDVHFYDENPEDFGATIRWMKDKMKKYGYQKPIWSLEAGSPFSNFTTEKFADNVAKLYIIGMANGAEKIFWSTLNPTLQWSDNFVRLALIDTNGRKTPAYYTYKLMAEKLSGISSVKEVSTSADVKLYKSTASSGDVYVAWAASSPSEITLNLPGVSKIQVTDIARSYGQTLPSVNYYPVNNGKVTISVSYPVFIELVK